MDKYAIFQRYEWRSSEGLKWTPWFRMFNSKITDTNDELKNDLKEIKVLGKELDKKTHSKSEYEIQKFDYEDIKISDMKHVPSLHKRKRGRPKKVVEEV